MCEVAAVERCIHGLFETGAFFAQAVRHPVALDNPALAIQADPTRRGNRARPSIR